MNAVTPEKPPSLTRRLSRRFGLSGRLLVLTILFVMIAEVLIYVPSIANYRLNWLRDKLSDAYTAALVLEATPEVPDHLTRQVLDSIGARAVAMKMGSQRRLLMVGQAATCLGALVILALAAGGALQVWHLAAQGFLGGLVWTGEMASRRRMLTEVAGEGDVVTAVGDRPVTTSTELTAAVRSHAPGEEVALTVRRDGDTGTVDVTLATAAG